MSKRKSTITDEEFYHGGIYTYASKGVTIKRILSALVLTALGIAFWYALGLLQASKAAF